MNMLADKTCKMDMKLPAFFFLVKPDFSCFCSLAGDTLLTRSSRGEGQPPSTMEGRIYMQAETLNGVLRVDVHFLRFVLVNQLQTACGTELQSIFSFILRSS